MKSRGLVLGALAASFAVAIAVFVHAQDVGPVTGVATADEIQQTGSSSGTTDPAKPPDDAVEGQSGNRDDPKLPTPHKGPPKTSFYAVLGFLIMYAGLTLTARYLWVVKPSREDIRAEIETLKFEAGNLPDDPDGKKLKEAVRQSLDQNESPVLSFLADKPIFQRMLAFAGDHAAARKHLHAIERNLLLHPEYMKLHTRGFAMPALAQLERVPNPPTTLEVALKAALSRPKTTNTDLFPLVQQARAFNFAYLDEQFMSVADAKNKGLLLLLFSMLSLLGLVYLYPDSLVLFVAGSVGGLLARLRTAVAQDGPSFDFGLSWAVMYLTPLVGALTGWFGVLIIMVMNALGLTGGFLEGVSMTDVTLPQTVLVAFVFGLSATLFDFFITKIEHDLMGEKADEKQDLERQAVEATIREQDTLNPPTGDGK